MRRFIFVVSFCVLFLAVPACTKKDGGGGKPTAQNASQGPCSEDREKFCASVQPGGGRIIKCLDEHFKELSPKCQRMQEKRRARVDNDAKRAGVGPSDTTCAPGEDCAKGAAKKSARADKKKK